MTRITYDPKDPDIQGGGPDKEPVKQSKAYLVLSKEERDKGFIRPVRSSYVHVGRPGPKYDLRDLTTEEIERHSRRGYIKYEEYPETEAAVGRFWTQEMLEAIDNGCKSVTTMSIDLAETYAREPEFYGSTYCVGCQMHRPVGGDGEFVWDGTDQRVGT